MTKELEGAPETITTWRLLGDDGRCLMPKGRTASMGYINPVHYTRKDIATARIAELEEQLKEVARNTYEASKELHKEQLATARNEALDEVMAKLGGRTISGEHQHIGIIRALKTESIAGIKIETDENLPENVIEARHPDGRIDRFTIKTESTT